MDKYKPDRRVKYETYLLMAQVFDPVYYYMKELPKLNDGPEPKQSPYRFTKFQTLKA